VTGAAPDTVGDRLVSAGLWALGVGWITTVGLPITALMKAGVPSWRIDPLTRFLTRGQVAMTLCRWRTEVDPAVDPRQVYFFATNHVNVLDYATMYCSTPHFKQGINLRKHFSIPVYGWFMEARGTVPVDRGGGAAAQAALLAAMRTEVEHGRSLLGFPEGTRTRDGRVGPFKEGIFELCRQLGVPIVPVAVTGMHEVLGTGGWRFRPFQDVTVHVMAPVPTAGLSAEDVPALARDVQARVAAKVDAYYAARAT
jgi:1-acyl-sn-glycerol-3-phosphate acyltransferase